MPITENGPQRPRSPQAEDGLRLAGVTLRAFEIFVGVAERGSMTAAGDQLGVSQSAVSQAIRALELALGQTLFDRSLRPPALTLAGRAVLQHASGIVHHARSLERVGHGPGGHVQPLLRMGMANTFAVTVAPLLLEQVRHLARSWTISSGAGETRVDGLIDRRMDLIMTFDDTPPRADLLYLPVMSEPYCIAVPKAFRDKITSWQDVTAAFDMLCYGRHLHLSAQIDAYLARERIAPPSHFRLDTISAVIAMVAAGVGWSLVTPLSVLSSASLADRLRLVNLPGAPLRRNLVVAGRPEDGEAILTVVQAAAVRVLQSHCLPELRRLLPDMAAPVTLAKPALDAAREADGFSEAAPRSRRARPSPPSAG